jgi:hypothetical protein
MFLKKLTAVFAELGFGKNNLQTSRLVAQVAEGKFSVAPIIPTTLDAGGYFAR